MKLLIINGPNLNMLGKREPEIYGHETFEDILSELKSKNPEDTLDYFQSNYEGAILERIHKTLEEDFQAIIINAGAFTHYSYALLDALNLVKIPVIEVHMSHIHKREAFRHTSVISAACVGMITGFGKNSYQLAIHAAHQWEEA